jgi:hypothetical protein
MRYLDDIRVAGPAGEAAVGGLQILGFIDVQHFDAVVLFPGCQSRVLVAGETAFRVHGHGARRHRQKKKDPGDPSDGNKGVSNHLHHCMALHSENNKKSGVNRPVPPSPDCRNYRTNVHPSGHFL